MTFKQWLREINNNPSKANQLDALAEIAERQREIDEDAFIDTRFKGNQNNTTKANTPERETVMKNLCKAKQDVDMFYVKEGDILPYEVDANGIYRLGNRINCTKEWFDECFEAVNTKAN